MAKIGRPTALTDDTIERIVTALSQGATYLLAAKYGGVSYNTFNEWCKRGAKELERREGDVKEGTPLWEKEQPFVDFYERVQNAEATAAIGWLAMIQKSATDGNWTAAAWKLERRYPQDYGRKTVDVTHSGKDSNAIEVRYVGDNDGDNYA